MRYLSNLSPEPMGRRGFTLIELVAVLFIIAVSTAIVAINFGRSSDRAMLRDEALHVRNTLSLGRDMALMQRLPATFYVDVETGVYGIEGRGSRTPREGISVSSPEVVVFFPKGDSTGGVVVISSRDRRGYHVLVDRITGQARVERL